MKESEAERRLEELIGRPPDSVTDRLALTQMRDGEVPAFLHLVEALYIREDWQQVRLGALLPGLALLQDPRLTDLIGVRAVTLLARSELADWNALAAVSSASLAALPGVGPGALDEILGVAAREWAAAYLDAGARSPHPRDGTVICRPPTHCDAVPASGPYYLATAFEELERMPSFQVMKRRELDLGEAPTRASVAAERGVSTQRVNQMQATIRRKLARLMEDPHWPIRVAVESVRGRLGAVGRTEEIDSAFTAIDRHRIAFPVALPHRRLLLLQLAEYTVADPWVLGPDIESLTRVVLEALVDPESADLGAVDRHLVRLGVREEVQLPWIADQRGFQIVDGRVLRLADG